MTDSVRRNPLSCRLCKQKKIKCNRVEPRCGRCETTGVPCVYMPRRPRPKMSSTTSTPTKKEDNSELLKRLELLERRVAATESVTSPSDQTENSMSSATPQANPDEVEDSNPPLPLRTLVNEATDLARNLLHQPKQGSVPPTQESSMLEALDSIAGDLQGFKMIKDITLQEEKDATISKEQAKKWIQNFFDAYGTAACLSLIDRNFMLMIPDLVDNPLVQIDNATMITYYNLIFQGMAMDQCADDDYRRYSLYTYRRSLKLVEHWKTEPGQVMDCFAGFFMTWLAINFLDTNLAWSFLRRATIVGEKLGFFQVDAKGTDHSQESVNVVNDKRLAFWRLLQTDCLFRQHYGKPPLIQKGTWSVEFPDFNVVSMGEGPRHQIIFIIAMRLNFITIKFFEFLDSEGSKSPEALDNMIDSLAEEIETITREWNIKYLLESSTKKSDKWQYADALFGSQATMIHLYRASSSAKTSPQVPPRALEAARASLRLLKSLLELYPDSTGWAINFITFYPFVSFFTLYRNIIITTSYTEASSDLHLTLWVGITFNRWAKVKPELGPLNTIIQALNQVCQKAIADKFPPERHSPRSHDIALDWGGESSSDSTSMNVDIDKLMQNPAQYMHVLEMVAYKKDPHAHWWELDSRQQ